MELNNKIYLAPFQGVTTYTFREIYTRYFNGVVKMFTPFYTSIDKTKSLEKRGADLNFAFQNGIEAVPQVLSKDAGEILRFADYCAAKGFKEINWNLGCPYPRVANKQRGSGMLPFPAQADKILSQLDGKMGLDFSIKCRLGYFSEEEIFPIIDVFNQHKISELTIHARIGKQLYSGGVNDDVFAKVIDKCRIPLAYNGDIFSVSDYENFDKKFSTIDNWMIGRGMLRDPFLPAKIKGFEMPPLEDQKQIIYKFVTDLYLAYRKKSNDRLNAISVMKEYWGFLSYSFSNQQKIFNKIKKTKSFDEYENAVAMAFSEYEWLGSR